MSQKKGKTLFIGGGYLAQHLIPHYLKMGPVDVMTRTLSRKRVLEEMGCRHFARDVSNTTWQFPLEEYQRIVFNPATRSEGRHSKTKQRLYQGGTANLFRTMRRRNFRGKCLIVGSTGAIPDLSRLETWPFHHLEIDEEQFASLYHHRGTEDTENAAGQSKAHHRGTEDTENLSPAYQQYRIWREEKDRHPGPISLVMSAGIYGPDRPPGIRVIQGLRKTQAPPHQWVNYVQVEDLARAVLWVDRLNTTDLFFVSNGNPVILKELYDAVSEKRGMPFVEFGPEAHTGKFGVFQGKRVKNSKIVTSGFRFEHPSIPGIMMAANRC